jgi:hypothetical protein
MVIKQIYLHFLCIISALYFFVSCSKDDAATCVDGIQNGNETGIDCGGDCRPCSCYNGLKDGDEECIDCGGDCFPCPEIRGRYVEPVYFTINRYLNMVYGVGISEPYNTEKTLTFTFYEPEGDTSMHRPLIIMVGQTNYATNADGSFFTDGIDYVGNFVSAGYIVANIVGIRNWDDRPPMAVEVFDRTAMRVRADIRAAVRFFKKYTHVFKVDTTNIWLMGASMGAMASLHAAYLDKSDFIEIDPTLTTQIMEDGGINGDYDYQEISSSVKGVISLAGMMFDVNMIDEGEPFLMCIMGKDDQYRPFGCELVKVNWIEEERYFCGPMAMMERMQAEGFGENDYLIKMTDISPADHYAPFDPAQCPACADEIIEFIASKLGYCQ